MPTRRTFLIQVAATGAALTTGVAATSRSPRPASAVGESRRRLIASIDCTKDYPPESFFANGVTRVVETFLPIRWISLSNALAGSNGPALNSTLS